MSVSRRFRRWQMALGAFWMLSGLWQLYRGFVNDEGRGLIVLGFVFLLIGPPYILIAYRQSIAGPKSDDEHPVSNN
jgi:cytochrome c biogenesis factor